MPEQPLPAARPGLVRRLAAGAWHVPAGFVFLFRNPPLWPLALLPVALAVLCVFAGLVLGALAVPRVDALLVPGHDRLPDWLGLLATLALWTATLCAGMAMGLAVALFLAAPSLELLSRRVEARRRGQALDQGRGLRWELLQSLGGACYFLAAAPLAFLVGLIPLIGPFLAALWAGRALAFQLTDGPLARRGLAFRDRRVWHRQWRAESIGFGLAGLITLVVPLANFLLAPALTVGGTMLVLDLEPSPAAPAPEPAAAAEPTEA